MNVDDLFGRNELRIAESTFLLVGGDKTHLAALAEPDADGRPAVPPERFDSEEDWSRLYDRMELVAPLWAERTVCGRGWTMMRAGEGPEIGRFGEQALAPDCRSCLRITSTRLASTERDDRIALVAAFAADETCDWGSAMIVGVPGDQVEHLRSAIRATMAGRGQRCGTRLYNEVVHVWLEGDLDPERQAAVDEAAMHVIERIATPDPAGDEQRYIDWRTSG